MQVELQINLKTTPQNHFLPAISAPGILKIIGHEVAYVHVMQFRTGNAMKPSEQISRSR
jgi:hypothetical protein